MSLSNLSFRGEDPEAGEASSMRRVPIRVKAPKARDVRVTGSFTGWNQTGIRLQPGGSGEWSTHLTLEPGEHQYRLLVDGKWTDHAEAAGRVANPYGSQNCILNVV